VESLSVPDLVRETVVRGRAHNLLQWGAALAFYAAVSLAPILLLLLSLAGPLVGSTAFQAEVERHAAELLGPGGKEIVRTISASVSDRKELPKGLALVALFGGATLFFVQLQTALNHIWNGEPRQRHVWRFLRRRATALGLTVILGVLVAASILIGGSLRTGVRLLEIDSTLPIRWLVSLTWLGSIVFFALLVGVLYETLPDVRLSWRDLAVAVSMTTVLFTLGRWACGLYLARSGVSSLYGAAGSSIVLLFWLYYSAVSALLAVEFTGVWAEKCGRPLRQKQRRKDRKNGSPA